MSDRVNNHNGAKRAEQKRELGLSDSWVAQWVGLYRKKATETQVPCDHAHVSIGAVRPQVVIEWVLECVHARAQLKACVCACERVRS